MAIPLGVDRKIAHHSAAGLLTAAGCSGAVEDRLTSEIANPEISLSYKSFASPTKEVTTVSLIYTTSVS